MPAWMRYDLSGIGGSPTLGISSAGKLHQGVMTGMGVRCAATAVGAFWFGVPATVCSVDCGLGTCEFTWP